MRKSLLFTSLLLACALSAEAPAQGKTATRDDAEKLVTCVSQKAGPEGDLPSAGELRNRILAEMEGGPQACIGLVRQACVEAGGGDHQDCSARETRAWLDALKPDDRDGRQAGRPRWEAATKAVRQQATALCQGAAARSAWGYETVRRTGTYPLERLSGCIMEAVAQQALIMLVNVRGN